MKKLYEFQLDCGRMGELSGLFIAETFDIKNLIGETIYFGEVLGKHSEIICDEFDEVNVIVKSEDQELITKLYNVFKSNSISGYNPLDY